MPQLRCRVTAQSLHLGSRSEAILAQLDLGDIAHGNSNYPLDPTQLTELHLKSYSRSQDETHKRLGATPIFVIK